MNSKKIESIFENYLNKTNTNYALLISGKWGSGKTFLWKNVLERKAVGMDFKPIYISLNGINSVREIEGILLSKVLPFSDKLENKYLINSIKFLRNGINVLGNAFAGGTQLKDITKGIEFNLDLSKMVLCFDDLERCSLPLNEILGLINDYTEHKNIKVIICADEEQVNNDEYHKIKEKIIERTLNYTANYNELFDSYINQITEPEFRDFLRNKRKTIIHFFKKHAIENLRTFGFYLENVKLLFEYYKSESKITIESMLFFTAIISNEFKNGELAISNLKDKKGIDDPIFYIDVDKMLDEMDNKRTIETKLNNDKEKSYRDSFHDKYLKSQNEKDIYLFSDAIYEFVLSGYLNPEKLKNEIDSLNGKNNDSEEQLAYKTLIGYNFRMLDNDELETLITKVLEYAKQGKYNMYSYQTIYNNLSYHIKIGSLGIKEQELISILSIGLEISKNNFDVHIGEMENILHFRKENELNDIEKQILKFHIEKRDNQKSKKANEIFDIINQEPIEVHDFFNKILNSENSLFEFIDANLFFDKLIGLENKKLLTFNNVLNDTYKRHYIEFPESELPFLTGLQKLLEDYLNSIDLKNPKKILLQELIDRIKEIITRFKERIELLKK